MSLTEDELDDLMKSNPDLAKANGKLKSVKTAPAVSPDAPEADFQAKLIKELKNNGWLVHSERPALSKFGKYMTPIQGDAGFCDVIAVRGGLILAIELKSKAGSLSPAQELWIIALAGCPAVKVIVARPEDWEEILTIIKKEG